MACNPCCCMKPRDGAVTVGIWSVVYSFASIALFAWQTGVLNHCRTVTMSQSNLQCEYDCPCVGASTARTSSIIEAFLCIFCPVPCMVFAIAQLGIMGWQMAAIKYEKDRAANTLLPNYNTYGRYDIPSYYESYWQSPEERYYTGLFIIQILCLISAFFLLCASAAMIYGVHSWSRYLVWPWFPCMLSSILCSLAYCIMWWAGDVRDYWLALTFLELIGVFVNIFCFVIVMMFYRRLQAETDYFEGKSRGVRYRPASRSGHSSRKDLLEHTWEQPHYPAEPERFIAKPYPNYNNQVPPYSPYPQPQFPAPQYPKAFVPQPIQPNPPYPDPLKYDREPVVRQPPTPGSDDLVSSWVKDQQERSQHSQVNSEPPLREGRNYPMKHSRSVPSLFEGTLEESEGRRHRHRSSSRHRHRDRDRRDCDRDWDDRGRRDRRRDPSRQSYRDRGRSSSVGDAMRYSSESETATDFSRCRHSERKKHRSRSRHDNMTETDTAVSEYRHGRHSKKHRAERERDDKRDKDDRRRRDRREDKDDERTSRSRRRRERDSREEEEGEDAGDPSTMTHPLSGGITIPQHIVIPPSQGERGPDGRIQPQKFQINSEIVIKYDKDGSEMAASERDRSIPNPRSGRSDNYVTEPYARRPQPISMQSNV